MKLTTLLLVIGLLQVSAASFAQHINLSEKNVPLEKLFKQLESQSGYTFLYKAGTLKNLPNVNVEINDATINEVLEKCFENKPLEYLIIDKSIVVKRKPVTAGAEAPVGAYVQGKVIDEKGQPLPGVSIKVKGTNFGFITDINGEFKAFIVTPDAVLQFSFVGFTTREIPVKDLKNPIAVLLRPAVNPLDEVQVIAYGTTTKRLTVGDQTTVNAKELEKYPTNNALNVLQATVPGLNIVKATGNPNGTYKVQLRGINGIRGNQPLYVVDGVPYQGGSYTTQNGTLGNNTAGGSLGQGGDALNFINPLDIESITVLKDADATAIYGSRASDGVIIITTKKGSKNGPAKYSINFYSGVNSIGRMQDVLNTPQYLQMRREAKKNDNTAITAADYDINGVWDTTRNANWAKDLFGLGHVTNAQASVTGGNNSMQYRISAGYGKTTNLTDLKGNDQTANASFSINSSSANNKFNVQLNGGYFYDINTTVQSDLTQYLTLAPDAPPLYNPDGTLNFQNNTFSNPLVNKNYINSTPAYNLLTSAVVSYRPISQLEFKVTTGYNRQTINEFLGNPSNIVPPFSQPNSPTSTFTNTNVTSWSIEPTVNYKSTLGKGDFAVTLGTGISKDINEVTQLKASGYSSDLLLRSISAGTSITSISPYAYTPHKISSVFGRASYVWNNKYIVDASGRMDGSSNFGENKKFGFFGGVGAGWIFSEEKFIKDNLTFLSFGKIKASYGSTGRDAIGTYGYLDTYISTTYPYQSIAGLIPTRFNNPDLHWETTKKLDIGVQLYFLKNRIGIEANYYRNRTTDVLNGTALPAIAGLTSFIDNLPAVIQNKGFDLTLRTENIRTKNFGWTTSFIITRERNQMLSYPTLNSSTNASIYTIGQPVNIVRANRFAGVNPQTGLYQFYSFNGSIVSNPGATDKVAYININPDFYGALQNTLRYKGFSLDVTFRFIKQIGKNAFGQMGSLPPGLFANTNFNTIVLNRWQKPGDITDIARYTTSILNFAAQGNATASDHGYGDASYVRLQNAVLSYQIPESVLRKVHINGLQLFVQGENLLTISKYGAIDPESQSVYSIPPLRTVAAGLRLTL